MAQRFPQRERNRISNSFNSSNISSRIALKLIRIAAIAIVKRLKYRNAILITNKRRLVPKKLF